MTWDSLLSFLRDYTFIFYLLRDLITVLEKIYTFLKRKKRGNLLHQTQRTFFTVSSALRVVPLISLKSQATIEFREGLQIMKELS